MDSPDYAIDVDVATRFLDDQSAPEDGRYVFAYTIRIHNRGRVPAQLLRRHWVITDANGKVQEVHGEGVAAGQVVPQAPAGLQAAPQRVDQSDTQRDAANDGLWRWKMAAGFASVAAVALLGWNVLTLQPQAGSMALMAQQSPATVPQEQQSPAAAPAGQTALVMADSGALPEPQLEEMLAAHAQVGGQSLLPELTMASLDTR